MRKVFPSFLIACILFLATTFAGMAFFGMGAGGVHMEGACAGDSCGDMDHGAGPLDCVDHCLAQVSPAAALPAAAAPLALVLLLWTLAVLPSAFRPASPEAPHWREGIGKRLTLLKISTVVLRN